MSIEKDPLSRWREPLRREKEPLRRERERAVENRERERAVKHGSRVNHEHQERERGRAVVLLVWMNCGVAYLLQTSE